VTQVGRRLTSAPPFTLEQGGTITYPLSLQHRVDGTSQLMGEHRQRLAFAMFFLQAGQILVACQMVAEEEDRRCGERPCERRIADLRAGGAIPLPRRFLGAFDQAAIGHNILDPRETGDIMERVKQDQTQHRANAGDGLASGPGVCVVLLGGPHARPCEIAESRILAVNQGQIACHTFLHGGSGTALGDPVAVRFVGDLLVHLGEVVLPVGLLHMRQELRAFARQMSAAPEQSTGRPHRGRGDVGLWEHAAAEQDSDFLGVHPVVVGFATMAGFHRQGMAEDNRQAFVGTQVGEPVPRKDALHGADDIFPIGGNDLQKRLWARLPIAVDQNRAGLVQETDVHGAGMQVDAAVKWVLLGVEAHEVSSSSLVLASLPAYHGGMWRRGPQ